MKKTILAIMLSAVMVCSLTACGNTSGDGAGVQEEGGEEQGETQLPAWKEAYKNTLNGILNNEIPLSDGMAATNYSDLGGPAYFALYDFTGNGTPELIVTGSDPHADYIVSEIYMEDGTSYQGFDAFDASENKIYCNKDLETVIYVGADGKLTFSERYNEYGADGWYYSNVETEEDKKISDEEGQAFSDTHKSLRKEFKNCFGFTEMTRENINSMLAN
ncbi:MAG: hypothetical protein K6G07_03090 [Lachnospiraceae bacterium]|nr:hypothetical protein [Lachnospiraceae bacterium]